MGQFVKVSDEGRVRYVTIDRPDQLNALCSELVDELHDIVTRTNDDPAIGCLVLRGTGGRAFCAGADLGEILGADQTRAAAFIDRGHELMNAIAGSPVPVVAAIDGWALGGGFELALACHLRIGSTTARLGLPEAKIGCMPGFGGTQRIFAATSSAMAMRLLLTGDPLDAEEAHAAGLLSFAPVVPDRFDEHVASVAARIADGSRPGNARILRAAASAGTERGLWIEANLAAEAIASPDGQEGIGAFDQKRTPQFSRDEEQLHG